MFVLRLSDDGSTLRFASIHMTVYCGKKVEDEFGETLAVTTRRPTAKQLRSTGYLVGRKVRDGALKSLLYTDNPDADGRERLRGSLQLKRIAAGTLTATWTIRATWQPKRGRGRGHTCTARRTFAMHREPGAIFVGETTDSEPVEIVCETNGVSVAPSLGYWAECKTDRTDYFRGRSSCRRSCSSPTARSLPAAPTRP